MPGIGGNAGNAGGANGDFTGDGEAGLPVVTARAPRSCAATGGLRPRGAAY